jgi:hypothetical protein
VKSLRNCFASDRVLIYNRDQFRALDAFRNRLRVYLGRRAPRQSNKCVPCQSYFVCVIKPGLQLVLPMNILLQRCCIGWLGVSIRKHNLGTHRSRLERGRCDIVNQIRRASGDQRAAPTSRSLNGSRADTPRPALPP